MISLWWSSTLTRIGVAGMVCVYRYPASLLSPAERLSVQRLWIAYARTSYFWMAIRPPTLISLE